MAMSTVYPRWRAISSRGSPLSLSQALTGAGHRRRRALRKVRHQVMPDFITAPSVSEDHKCLSYPGKSRRCADQRALCQCGTGEAQIESAEPNPRLLWDALDGKSACAYDRSWPTAQTIGK